ncbi:hypothetical protein HORIV_15830 [Vreelandella olivaria]|uniref:Uncharacterized protein n=1 Tax=Vreelandella olivaria TaxID=390919 RepID=A0ABM7GFK2_9GAMM|nr:hypothetical protein HORIV_15830 [Halomonas olivaria]
MVISILYSEAPTERPQPQSRSYADGQRDCKIAINYQFIGTRTRLELLKLCSNRLWPTNNSRP